MIINSFTRKFPQTRDKHRNQKNAKRISGAYTAEYKIEQLQCANNIIISNY